MESKENGERKRNWLKWGLFLAIGMVLPIIFVSVYAFFESHAPTLPYYGDLDKEEKTHYQVPPFKFIDQDSLSFASLEILPGKITVIHSFFTSCGSICPKMIKNDIVLAKKFKDDDNVYLLSFTVDPERDTPSRLSFYAQSLGLDLSKWKLLTGEKKDLYLFARKGLFIAAADGNGTGDKDDFIHSEQAVLLDKQQHIRGYFDLSSNEGAQSLANAIKTLEKQN